MCKPCPPTQRLSTLALSTHRCLPQPWPPPSFILDEVPRSEEIGYSVSLWPAWCTAPLYHTFIWEIKCKIRQEFVSPAECLTGSCCCYLSIPLVSTYCLFLRYFSLKMPASSLKRVSFRLGCMTSLSSCSPTGHSSMLPSHWLVLILSGFCPRCSAFSSVLRISFK